nr:cinnamoyl-CoA reductase-like SNL6 [Tanacetum cinerariifolium]
MEIIKNSTIGNGGVEAEGPWLKAKTKILKLASQPRWKMVASVRWTAEHTSLASNNTMTQGLSNAPEKCTCYADAVPEKIIWSYFTNTTYTKHPCRQKCVNSTCHEGSMEIVRNSKIGNGGVEAKGPYLAMVVYHAGDMAATLIQQHKELIINERCLGLDHPDTTHIFVTIAKKHKMEKGAAKMYRDGVLVTVNLKFLVDSHICVCEDISAYGRYICFNHVINCNEDVVKLTKILLPVDVSLVPPSKGRQDGATKNKQQEAKQAHGFETPLTITVSDDATATHQLQPPYINGAASEMGDDGDRNSNSNKW